MCIMGRTQLAISLLNYYYYILNGPPYAVHWSRPSPARHITDISKWRAQWQYLAVTSNSSTRDLGVIMTAVAGSCNSSSPVSTNGTMITNQTMAWSLFEDGHFKFVVLLVYNILQMCESVLILCGNILTIFIVTSYKKMRTATNVLIANLSAADCLHGLWPVLGLTLDMFSYRYSDHTWLVLCHVLTILSMGGSLVNFVTVMLIAVERLISVVYPIRYINIVTKRKLILICCFVWIFTFAQVIYLSLNIPFSPEGLVHRVHNIQRHHLYKLGKQSLH